VAGPEGPRGRSHNIWMRMDCVGARTLIELELEGALGASAARELEEHLVQCRGCAALRAELTAIDRVLFDHRFERAPDGLAAAVQALVARRGARRRVPEPVVIAAASAIGAAGAAYGIARAFGAGLAGRLSQWISGLLDGLRVGAEPVAARVPGLHAGLWDNPAAAGVLFALAAAALAFLVVVLVRFPRQMSVEWR